VTVTVWLNITARLITPTEQGERLFRDDVRSSVRDQTSRAPHYERVRTKDAGTDGRRELRARVSLVTRLLPAHWRIRSLCQYFQRFSKNYVSWLNTIFYAIWRLISLWRMSSYDISWYIMMYVFITLKFRFGRHRGKMQDLDTKIMLIKIFFKIDISWFCLC